MVAFLSMFVSGELQFPLVLSISSILLLMVTTVLLIIDLKQPRRFHWILLRPQWRSWLTRGAFILIGFSLFLGLNLFDRLFIKSETIFAITFYLAVLFGFGSAIYSAFLFWQAKGRDFWQSPLFAVHLIVMALLAGAGAAIIIDDSTPGVRGILLVSLLLHGALIALDLMAVHSTNDAKIAARSVYRKNWPFWFGAIFVGIVVPLILLPLDITGAAGQTALIGLLMYERVWVRAGQVVPLS